MSGLRPRAGRPRGIARHGRLRRAHPVATLVRMLATGLVVVLVAAVAVGGIALWDLRSSVGPSVRLVHADGGGSGDDPPDLSAVKGQVNLLLAGTDTREGQGVFATEQGLEDSSGRGNSDVTILLHISADHRSATAVSFPRDTIVPIPSCPDPDGGRFSAMSAQMLNSSLSYGGLPCTVLTVEQLTGLTIPYAAVISFDGVTAMSEAVGGVQVCVASRIDDTHVYPPLHLSAGEHTIVGPKALSFVRSRHGVGDGSDLGRISNQQLFLSAMMRKVTHGGVLSDPVKVYKLAKAVLKNVQVSESLDSVTTLVQLALALKDVKPQNFSFVQYPVVDDPDNPNRVIPQQWAAAQLVQALANDEPVRLTGSTGRAAESEAAADGTDGTGDGAGTGTSAGTDGTGTGSPDDAATGGDAANPDPSGSPAPGSTPAPTAGPVELPSTITGQTAAQHTCTKGNG